MKEFKKPKVTVTKPKPLTNKCEWLLRFVEYDGELFELPRNWLKDPNAKCLKLCPKGRKYCDLHAKMHNYRQWSIRHPKDYQQHLRQRRLASPGHDPTALYSVEGFDLRAEPEPEKEMPKKSDAEVESSQREINANRRHHKEASARDLRRLESSPGYLLLQKLTPPAQAYSRKFGWHELPGMTYDKLMDLCKEEHRKQRAAP